MAKTIRLTVTGERELQRAFRKLEKQARTRLKPAMQAGGKVILSAAKAKAPVRTGYLRDHLTIKTAFDDEKGVVIVVGGTIPDKTHSSNLAWWQEYGTSKQAARPFLRPAFDESQRRAQAAILAAMKRAIK